MKNILMLLGCVCSIFILVGCSEVKTQTTTISEPVPIYDLENGQRVYKRVDKIDKSNVDALLGEVKKIGDAGTSNDVDWYSTKFKEGDKVYKYKGKDVSEEVIVEENGFYYEMKIRPKQ